MSLNEWNCITKIDVAASKLESRSTPVTVPLMSRAFVEETMSEWSTPTMPRPWSSADDAQALELVDFGTAAQPHVETLLSLSGWDRSDHPVRRGPRIEYAARTFNTGFRQPLRP